VPQKGCDGCHTNVTGVYDLETSSTYHYVMCSNHSYSCDKCLNEKFCAFVATYETCNLTDPTQPCSVSCQLFEDDIGMGSQEGNLVFGAIYSQTKNFQQFFYIDGVVGFIGSGSSSFGGISAFQRMVDLGKYPDIFAMCLNPYNGGVLTLGGTDPSLQTGNFGYSPLTVGLGYSLKMSDILVAGKSVGVVGTHPIIIDSGTNVLLQPSEHFSLIYRYFQSSLCPGFPVEGVCEDENLFTGMCYNYSQSDLQQFPTLSIVLKGVTLTVDGTQYLVKNGPNSGTYCLGIASTGVMGIAIIGDVIMQAYYVAFDNVNSRIGWAPVNAEECMSKSLSAAPVFAL